MCICASWLLSEMYAFPNFLSVRDPRFSFLLFFPPLPVSGILEYFARPQACLQLVVAVQ